MKYFFFILLASLGVVHALHAGELRRAEVSLRQPLDIRYNSISEILAGQTIHNALEIKLPSGNSTGRIAAVVSILNKDATILFGNAFCLRLSGSMNSRYEAPGSEIYLTEKPKLLLSYKSNVNPEQAGLLYFDFALKGIHFSPPKDIEFSISFIELANDGQLYIESGNTLQVVSGTISVPPLQEFEIEPGNRRPISFSSVSDYINGVTIDGFYYVRIKSNIPWILTVTPTDDAFTPMTFPASKAIPTSVIKFKVASNSTFEPLSRGGTRLASSGVIQSFEERLPVSLRFDPGIAYRAGIYNLNFKFDLSTP